MKIITSRKYRAMIDEIGYNKYQFVKFGDELYTERRISASLSSDLQRVKDEADKIKGSAEIERRELCEELQQAQDRIKALEAKVRKMESKMQKRDKSGKFIKSPAKNANNKNY